MRVVVTEPVTEGQAVDVTITPDGEDAGRDQGHRGVGAAARRQDRRRHRVRRARRRTRAALLAKLTQWQVVKDGERTRVVLRGDFTEATRFDELLPAMVGRIVFDMAQVTYMNSLGVRAWCEFLRQARIQGYEFHACSVPFVLQASMVRDVIGRGTVTSFFAPFHCISCDHQEERLLQSAAILASNLEPPVVQVPELRRRARVRRPARALLRVPAGRHGLSSRDAMRKLFVRSFVIAFVAFAVLFGVEFFLEWSRAGLSGVGRARAGRASTTPSSSTSSARWRARTTTCSRC